MDQLRRLFHAAKERSLPEFINDIYEYVYWKIHGTQTLEINGYSAIFDADIDRGGARNRRRIPREKTEIKYMIEDIKPTDVVYDIGANIGLYTCFLSQHVPDGNIIAFEPYPPNVAQLRRNVSYNTGPVQIYQIALSDSWGTVDFNTPKSTQIGYGTSSIATGQTSTTVSVKTAPGDELIEQNKIPRPNVVKIDVEGSEPLVINGMKSALESDHCRLLICELHLKTDDNRPSVYDFDTTPDQLITEIEDLGFEIRSQIDHGDAIHIRALKTNGR